MTKIDWYKEISNVSMKSDTEHLKYLSGEAGNWITCAVGNKCSDFIYRNDMNVPIDEDLRDLGYAFGNTVETIKDIVVWNYGYGKLRTEKRRALRILDNIEKVSKSLIREEINKMKRLLTRNGYSVRKK